MENNYPPNFMDSRIKSFLNKLYTPELIVQIVPKRNVLVKLPFLESTSFPIRKKLQKLFNDKLKACNLKIVFASPVRVKKLTPSRTSYLRYYFQDFFTSISVVAAMLAIMVRPNVILKSKFASI